MSDNQNENNLNSSDQNNEPILSIEYPNRNQSQQGGGEEENIERISQQPRQQPHNLETLLRFAVEANTTNEQQGDESASISSVSAPSQSQVRPLNEENSRFLMSALNSMTINIREEFNKIISTLLENQNDEDLCIETLDNLSEYVCNLDYANDFIQMPNGLNVLKMCLNNTNSDEIVWKSAETIADIVQNNPFAQAIIINSDLYKILTSHIEDINLNKIIRIKCFYAISCLIRENEECLKVFIKESGMNLILKCLQSNIDKLIIKTCFLIISLCNYNNIKNLIYTNGIIQDIIILITINDNDCNTIDNCNIDNEMNEYLLGALLSIIKNFQDGINLCKDENLNLKYKLKYINQKYKNNDVYYKHIEYVKEIRAELNIAAEDGDEEEEIDH